MIAAFDRSNNDRTNGTGDAAVKRATFGEQVLIGGVGVVRGRQAVGAALNEAGGLISTTRLATTAGTVVEQTVVNGKALAALGKPATSAAIGALGLTHNMTSEGSLGAGEIVPEGETDYSRPSF